MMDQAESSPSPASRTPASRLKRPDPRPGVPALRFEHPVVAGYDGSASSRNALAYAAGLSLRLAGRCSSCTSARPGFTVSR